MENSISSLRGLLDDIVFPILPVDVLQVVDKSVTLGSEVLALELLLHAEDFLEMPIVAHLLPETLYENGTSITWAAVVKEVSLHIGSFSVTDGEAFSHGWVIDCIRVVCRNRLTPLSMVC